MTPAERTAWVCERARNVGFDLCGVADPNALAELVRLREWLARGYAGEMNYLRDPRRADPALVLEGVRSLIVVALNYNSPQPYSTEFTARASDDSPRGWISRYAWGDDYHDMIGRKLHAFLVAMRAQFAEPFEARAYVDTGPIVERVAAKYAGLGWLAKNTCLINQQLGSWLFLGAIVTTLELAPSLAPDELPPPDLCGSCTACLDACPTQAFPEPYVLDARRCISYLTIELRGAIPEDLRDGLGQAVFGCDICQDVCPWNRKAAITNAPEFAPRILVERRNSKFEIRKSAGAEQFEKEQNLKLETRDSETSEASIGTAESKGNSKRELRAPQDIEYADVSEDSRFGVSDLQEHNTDSLLSLLTPELEWIAALSQQEFSAAFRRSAVKRTKWRGMARNACVALGNVRLRHGSDARVRIVNMLESLARSDDGLIAEHARWALERLKSRNSALEIRDTEDRTEEK